MAPEIAREVVERDPIADHNPNAWSAHRRADMSRNNPNVWSEHSRAEWSDGGCAALGRMKIR